MRLKRLSVLLTVLALCVCFGAATADGYSKAQYYDLGIQYLGNMNVEDVRTAGSYFASAGNYGQAKLFAVYAQALEEIFAAEEDINNLTLARMDLELVDIPEFAEVLTENDLPSVAELQVYIQARRYEIDGQYDEAVEAYRIIMHTLDALNRQRNIAINKNDMIYQKAMELFGEEDYIAAAKLFQELNDWKDSAAMYEKSMALHRHEWVAATCMTPKTCAACGATEGSPLGHSWKAATCTEPKTCTRCGQTEGKALGHNWKNATCTEPKTCQRCGLTEGKGQNHDWKAATCTEPKTCRRCGLTEGKALGHNWRAATCTEPKTCTRCGAIEGKALGHTWKAATCTEPKTCTRCGAKEGTALGHNWKAATSLKPETCSRCGLTRGKALNDDVTNDFSYMDCGYMQATITKYNGSATTVVIPDIIYGRRVVIIGSKAFSGCKTITSITIPNTVKRIGEYAFQGCSHLTEVTIPSSVTSIGPYAFGDCSALSSITIPDSVEKIDAMAFYGCRNLTVTVTRGSYAEQYCKDHNIRYKTK